MRATLLSSSRVNSTTFLLLSLSLSPACAVAFRSSSANTSFTKRDQRLLHGSRNMKSLPSSPPILRSSSVLFSSFLFNIRGGDEDISVTSDETSSLTSDDSNKMKRYGSPSLVDEESGSLFVSESQKMKPIEVGDDISISGSQYVATLATGVLSPVKSALAMAATYYTQQLTARPVLTKSMTAAVIFGLSDWCAQLIEREGSSSDAEKAGSVVFSRVIASFLVGLLFFGPVADWWYGMMFRYLPSTSLVSTLYKALLGQIFFGPAFTCVFFFAGLVQSGTFTLAAWLAKIQTDLFTIWASGLCYWPLVDFVSYKVVPVQWIPLFVNTASFIWTIYLSSVANRSKADEV